MPIETLAGVTSDNNVICVFILKEDLRGVKRVFLRRIDSVNTGRIPIKRISMYRTIKGVTDEQGFIRYVLKTFVEVDASSFNLSRVPDLENCIRVLRKKRN